MEQLSLYDIRGVSKGEATFLKVHTASQKKLTIEVQGFLKFNPDLIKQVSLVNTDGTTNQSAVSSSLSPHSAPSDHTVEFKGSVEVESLPGGTLELVVLIEFIDSTIYTLSTRQLLKKEFAHLLRSGTKIEGEGTEQRNLCQLESARQFDFQLTTFLQTLATDIPPRISLKRAAEHDVAPDTKQNICIATSTLAPFETSITAGFFYHELSEQLAAAGHKVTILYIPTEAIDQNTFHEHAINFSQRGIILRQLSAQAETPDSPLHRMRSYETYLWLNSRKFDRVYFHAMLGTGYYSCLARYAGTGLSETAIYLGIHSPTALRHHSHSKFPEKTLDLEINYMERRSAETADVVFVPDRLTLSWIDQQQWQLPENSFITPYPTFRCHQTPSPITTPNTIKELVFWGHQSSFEELKLFHLVVGHVLQMENCPIRRVSIISPLPDESQHGEQLTVNSLVNLRNGWKKPFRWHTNFSSKQALRYLTTGAKLVVLPSIFNNCLSSILECLQLQIPFVATCEGQSPELFMRFNSSHFLSQPEPTILAKQIFSLVKESYTTSVGQKKGSSANSNWNQFFHPMVEQKTHTAAPVGSVAVCVDHNGTNKELADTLSPIQKLKRKPLETVVCTSDMNLELPATDLASTTKVLKLPDASRAQRWNSAALQSHADYLVFISSGSTLSADCLTLCQQHLVGNQLDGCVGIAHRERQSDTDQPEILLPIGPCAQASFFEHCIGYGFIMLRRSTFITAGGFTPNTRHGADEWEFLNRLVLGYYKIELVPELVITLPKDKATPTDYSKSYWHHAEGTQAFKALSPDWATECLNALFGEHT